MEFAPDLGATTQLILDRAPAQYTAIDRDEVAVRQVSNYPEGSKQRCILGNAEHTNLPDTSATEVYEEAMLTMQMASHKEQNFVEAAKILKPRGRFFIEVCFLEKINYKN